VPIAILALTETFCQITYCVESLLGEQSVRIPLTREINNSLE
jgi:hypothetical protein